MRFLVAHPGPSFSVHDVYSGWVEALRDLGLQVFEFNLADRLTFYGSVLMEAGAGPDGEGLFRRALTGEQAVEMAVNGLYAALLRVRPHVLVAVSAFFLPPELFDIARAAGVRVVILHTESPYEDGRQAEIGRHADLNLVNDPSNLERFEHGHYFGHAYRPQVHFPPLPVPPDPGLASDLVFVGTGFPSRVEFFESMQSGGGLDGVDVALAGNWQLLAEESPLRKYVVHGLDDCLDNTDTARLYRSAKIGLNLYRREAERPELSAGWALGPREVEMAATGLFFLRDPRGEGDQVLDMLPTFTSPGDASDQLRWWLTHPDRRAAAAEKARAAIHDRTFTVNARRLLRLLEGE